MNNIINIFKNSSIFFSASKTATELQFSDSLGLRNLKIKPCNRKIINKFWSNLEKSVSTLQFSKASKGRVPSSDAWVKYEGIKYYSLNLFIFTFAMKHSSQLFKIRSKLFLQRSPTVLCHRHSFQLNHWQVLQ